MVQFLDVPRFSPIQPLDFSPLSKLADDTVSTWKAQAVGDPLSRGDFSGARAAAARAGYDIPTLLTLGDKELQAQERARQQAAIAKMRSDPSLSGMPVSVLDTMHPEAQGKAAFDWMTADRANARAYALENMRHQKALELERMREGANADLRSAQTQYYSSLANKTDNAVNADAERRRMFLDQNFYRDEDGNLQRRPQSGGDTMPPLSPSGPGTRAPGGMRPPMRLGGPMDDVTVQRSSNAPPNGVQVAQAGPPAAIPMPPFPQGGSVRDMKAWADTAKELRKQNAPADRRAAIANKPDNVEDNSLTDDLVNEYYDAKFPGARTKGHIWRRDGTLQKLETTQGERQALIMARDGLEAVRSARDLLKDTNTLQEMAGFGVEIPYVGRVRPGANLNEGAEKASIAHRSVGSAMHDILKQMSGSAVSDKERAAYVDMYMPGAMDTAKERQWKLDRLEQFFNNTIKSQRAGATAEDVARMVRQELEANIPPQANRRAPGAVNAPPGAKVYDPSTGGFKEVR